VTRSVAFRQSDLERAARALKAVGETVTGVDIRPDGSFTVLTTAAAPPKALTPLEAWDLEHGDRAA
jgi:hypothetical protein